MARPTAADVFLFLLATSALLFPAPARVLVALVVPASWLARAAAGGAVLPATPLNSALGFLLASVAMSLAVTPDVLISLGKVCGVLLGTMLFWTITRHVTNESSLRWATRCYLLAGGGLAVVGLLGTNWAGKFPVLAAVLERLPRVIRGVPGAADGFHPNPVGGCLALFVPLQIALLVTGEQRWLGDGKTRGAQAKAIEVGQWLLLALTAGTLLLTQSRGAFAGLAVGTAVLLACHGARARRAVLAACATLALGAILVGPSRLLGLAISHSGPGIAGNVSGRLELWSRAIYGIEDLPLTGMGMNIFRHAQPVLYPAFSTAAGFDVAHAHNQLLQTALDLGLPGLIAYMAVWLLLAKLLGDVGRRAAQRHERILACALGAGLAAHGTFMLTDAVPLGAKVGVLFWLALALAAALHRVALPPRP
jgi:putative inorganic carbon (HCO3(-)) transporter